MRVNISLPDELVQKIDLAAQKSYQTRSAYIRLALIARLRYEGEPDIPRTISDQEFHRARMARASRSVKQSLKQ
jgi:Arc/MetJ-type ribon-helix-helix transcriptional regulator